MVEPLRLLAATWCLVVLAGCQTAVTPTPAPSGSSIQPSPTPYRGPAEFGPTIPVLWQGAPWGFITVAGALVLGISFDGSTHEVRAVSATTGMPAWAAVLPQAQPAVLGIIPGDRIVVVQVGRHSDTPAGFPFVTENIALDIATGRQLWTAPVSGRYQSPALAIAGDVVVMGEAGDILSGRQDTTGGVLWRRPRPAVCQTTTGSTLFPTVSAAADGSLLAASLQCRNGRVMVQRLAVQTGVPVWEWTSPDVRSPMLLSTVGAVERGKLVLLAGQIAPPSAAQQFVRALPNPQPWPERLGQVGFLDTVLAIDADSGQPRWTEFGGQLERYAFANGSLCEIVRSGFECRDDVTGGLTRPIMLTGLSEADSPPYIGDGWAGISGPVAAAVVTPVSPAHVAVLVVLVQGNAAIARREFLLATKDYRGGNDQPFIVAAGQMPDGSTLALLRRVDVAGYPVTALRLPNPATR